MGDSHRLKSKAVILLAKPVYGTNITLQSDPNSIHGHTYTNIYAALGLKFLSFYKRACPGLNDSFHVLVQEVFKLHVVFMPACTIGMVWEAEIIMLFHHTFFSLTILIHESFA